MTTNTRKRQLCLQLGTLLLDPSPSKEKQARIRDTEAALRRLLEPVDCCQKCGCAGAEHTELSMCPEERVEDL